MGKRNKRSRGVEGTLENEKGRGRERVRAGMSGVMSRRAL